jgi:hypothetical protein
MKVAVVSAYFIYDHKTDELCTFTKYKKFDYICFTNNRSLVNNELWDIREIDIGCTNGLFMTKYVKWKTHILLPEYDIIVWVDSFININNIDILETSILSVYNNEADILIRNQHVFTCIDNDLEWCIKANRITTTCRDSFVEYLRLQNIDITTPCDMYWTSGMIKNNKNDKINKMGDELYEL